MENYNPWKTLTSTIVYENNWLKLIEDDCLGPDQQPCKYTYLSCKKVAVGIIPIDDQGNTWLVGQFRYPTNSYEWEIPMGGAEPGEDLLTCAKRELAEETGLVAESWELIQELLLSDCLTNERSGVFLAKNLRQGTASPEPTEKLTLKKLPISEALNMAINGEIRDSVSVAALLKLKFLLKND